MRIKLRYLVQSGGPNFIPSVRSPVRLVPSEKYTQPSISTVHAKSHPQISLPFLNQAPKSARVWFLEIALVLVSVACVCVCVCVCLTLTLDPSATYS